MEVGEFYRNAFWNNNDNIYFFTDRRFLLLDKADLNILNQIEFEKYPLLDENGKSILKDKEYIIENCQFATNGYKDYGGFLLAFYIDDTKNLICNTI